MATPSRTEQFANLFKILKKHYKPVASDGQRAVLEQLLFAFYLENAHYDVAEEAFAALVHTFFDWNEVRVTTISELSETLARLPDPAAAATRVKRVLQHVFEETYQFNLEELRKANLGAATERLQKIQGASPFAVAYTVQAALGGHWIPVDTGTLSALHLADLVSDKDVEAGTVPGLERAVPKNKGSESSSLLHQFGADYAQNPYAPHVRKILQQLNPKLEENLPKRRSKKDGAAPETTAKPDDDVKTSRAAPAADDTGENQPAASHEPGKKASRKKAKSEPTAPPASRRKATEKQPPAKTPRKKSPPAKDGVTGRRASGSGKSDVAGTKKEGDGLAKRKPR